MIYVKVLFGFVFLLGGADILVRGAVGLARRLDISPLVIGMTIIAFGTSAPEFMVSFDAALAGSSAMALGNVIGSNIANILLIIGVAALLRPISIKPFVLTGDGLMLFGATALFAWFCWRGVIDNWQGGILLVVFVFFIAHAYWRGSHDGGVSAEMYGEEVKEFEGLTSLRRIWMALLAGLAGIILGADLLVDGGSKMARIYGVADEVIGLTVLAIGTSLPELAASVVAAMRGHVDVAVGNVIGSNLFNLLAVIGSVALVMPLDVPQQVMNFDLWLMLGVTALMLPFFVGGWRLSRPVAFCLLMGYGAYITAQAYGVAAVLEMLS